MNRFRRASHLVRRFFGSLRPGGPQAADIAWVASVLQPDELALWSQLSNADRRHSVAVARRVMQALADDPVANDPRWLAAALLHDVGKVDAGLGTVARVGATLAGAARGRDRAKDWSTRAGITRKVGLYLRHPELGEARIREAGGRDEAARWARAHHEPATWHALAFPADVVAALHDADDD
jgi:hypothetical protein